MNLDNSYKSKTQDNYLERLTRKWVLRFKREIRQRINHHRLQDVRTKDVYPHVMKKAS